ESTLVMSTFNAISTILQVFDSYMAVATGHNQITLYSLPSKPESLYAAEMPLKICYIGSVPQEAADTYAMPLAIMKTNGFPARLEDGYKSDDYSEYINTMAKKLLSGDDDFDLFYVTSDMSELLRSQYYLDFSSFPLLKSQYDSMLPGAKELCSIDGKLCLALTHINFNVMQQNNALTQTNHPTPKNLDEVIALKEAVSLDFLNASSNFMSGSYYHSLVEPWFDQYAANFMAKNESAEKKETLKFLIETSLMLLQDKSVNIGAGRSADSYINFTQFAGIHSHNESENSSLAPVPKIDPSFKNTADSYFIAVNPNSKNKQLSAAFVAHVIEYKAFMGDVVLYENKDAIEDAKDYELYKALLGDSIRSYTNTKYMMTLADQFDALVSGATTAERAADEIYEFLKLVRDE
ncbi:MAG: hypothetical protein FWH48_12555, partial [Oscillospiraceae bacterium]|nr:hypothetical protein [Oscillospiraceae bacterium]